MLLPCKVAHNRDIRQQVPPVVGGSLLGLDPASISKHCAYLFELIIQGGLISTKLPPLRLWGESSGYRHPTVEGEKEAFGLCKAVKYIRSTLGTNPRPIRERIQPGSVHTIRSSASFQRSLIRYNWGQIVWTLVAFCFGYLLEKLRLRQEPWAPGTG